MIRKKENGKLKKCLKKEMLAGILVFAQAACSVSGIRVMNDSAVYAQETTQQETQSESAAQTGFTYTQAADGTCLITGYSGNETALTIPASIDGMTVSGIADRAFFENLSLTAVELPDTLTSIGAYAFFSCTHIESISLPAGLKTLGEGAFEGCQSLTQMTIPGGLENFGAYAFADCLSLQQVRVEDGIAKIPDVAFRNCMALTTVELADSVKEIGDRTFFNCSSLAQIALPAGMERVGRDAFSGTVLNRVETDAAVIESGAFDCGSLEEVIVKEGVTQIGKSAFSGIFTSASIPSTVTRMEQNSFRSSELASYEAASENSVYAVRDGVLYTKDGTVLLSVPVRWGEYGCTFTVPDGVTSIGEAACRDCTNFASIVIPQGVAAIGARAFQNCGEAAAITVADSVENIGAYAFADCGALEEITIGANVKELPEYVFNGCTALAAVNLSEGLLAIDTQAFGNCESLKMLCLPNSLESVDGSTFEFCSKGLTLTLKPDNTRFSIRDGVLCSYDGTVLIAYVDCGNNVYTIPDSVARMEKRCISSNSIKSITIPASVTEIQEQAVGFFTGTKETVDGSEENGENKNNNLVLCGAAGSEAERYAQENGFVFYTGKPVANAKERSLSTGETFSYVIENRTAGPISYMSSDTSVASVDQNGLVTATGMGDAFIFAETGPDSYCLKVSVMGDPVEEDPFDSYCEIHNEDEMKAWKADYMAYNSGISLEKKDNPNTYIYTTGSFVAIWAKEVGGRYIAQADAMLGKGLYEDFNAISDGLSLELKKYKLHENTKLFSGADDVSYITGASSSIEDIVASIGKTFTYDGVISTSLLHRVATNFGNIMLEIYAPKDQTDGGYIESMSEFPAEYELLLNAGNSFRVMDAGKRLTWLPTAGFNELEQKEEYFIKLELLPRGEN